MVYYNEIDQKKAAWLRELIKSGVIAPGVVDERSIVDVRAEDLAGFLQCHFFAGIGIWSYALRLAGFADDREVWTASCPCQPFSAAGLRKGKADERHLWPHVARLMREARPVLALGEQVASRDGLAWLDDVFTDLEAEGYTAGAVDCCAAGFGAPHIRQRLYWVAYHAGTGSLPGALHGVHRCEESRGPRNGEPERPRDAGLMAVTTGAGLEERRGVGSDGGEEHAATQRASDAGGNPGALERSERRCDAVELGNAARDEQRRTSIAGFDGQGITPGGSSGAGIVEHPEGHGRQQRRAESGGRGAECGRGAVNGFWRECDWIPCTDGKARPVKPGTFPLAHGITNRVLKLRGLGDCIVATQAAEWVRAVVEEIGG